MPMMGRHGQGSITRRADGRIQVSVTMSDGRRIYRYTRSEAEAERLRLELVEASEAERDPSRQTLAAYLRSWIGALRDARHQRIRPRTLEHYGLIVEVHIIPALGHLELGQIGERHVQRWLDRDPAAPRTVHHHRAVLRRALNVAVRQRILARNPAIAVELPDVPAYVGRPLTIDEARALLETTHDERLHVLWRLALDTGWRQAELLGLGWDDVELGAGTVRLQGQLQRLAGEWVRTPPKASHSLPRVTLMRPTIAALRAHQLRQAAERKAGWEYWGLVFLTGNGQPYHSTEVDKAWHRALELARIPDRRFHDLRGSSATLMAELGVEEAVRMARLGHATTDMARHYAVVREELDRDAARRLEEALG